MNDWNLNSILMPSIDLIWLQYISFVSLLRLEFDHSHLDYYTEIDAVSMAGLPEISTEMSTYDQMNGNVPSESEQLETENIILDDVSGSMKWFTAVSWI